MPASRARHVIVAESVFTERSLIADVLRSDGLLVHEVEDGRTALDLARIIRPDLLVIASEIPALSGLEVLAKVRADRKLHRMPVVVLVEDDVEELILPALDAGASDVIAKPPSPLDLLERVTRALSEQTAA